MIANGKALCGLIRLHPFDISTAKGRANERHRRVLLSAIASAFAKLISVATALISVPLTLHYLGAERYGLWMTISSLTAFLAFADLGIGNGMLNLIAAAHGRDDRSAIRGFVSSGFFALGLVSIGLLSLLGLTYQFVPWSALFNVHDSLAREEVGPAIAVFLTCFALAIPMTIVQRVQMALQRSFLSSLWQCLASTIGLIGVVVAIRHEASLPWLVFAFVGAPLFVSALNSIFFFVFLQPELSPARSVISQKVALQLMRTGGLFLVLQIVAAVTYASDNLVISQLLGASAVASYAVPERMFSLITMMLSMVLAPLWPAYGEAIARKDIAWVRAILRRSVSMAVIIAFFASFSLVLIGPWLMQLWVGSVVLPTMTLLVLLAFWKTIEAGGNAISVFLNGAHVVRLQVILATLTAVSALSLKLWLIPILGIPGAVLATILAFLVSTVFPLSILLPRLLISSNSPINYK
jgi:O-antigen/teichoic acid export membrane protein